MRPHRAAYNRLRKQSEGQGLAGGYQEGLLGMMSAQGEGPSKGEGFPISRARERSGPRPVSKAERSTLLGRGDAGLPSTERAWEGRAAPGDYQLCLTGCPLPARHGLQ